MMSQSEKVNKLLILTRDQAREVDRRAVEEFAVPSIILMENAGRGMVEFLLAHGIHGRIIICCGKGNNGGAWLCHCSSSV